MLEVAANPKHLGAKIGFLSILHTWGQNLRLHPHLHCVVPAGGFDPSYSRWVHPKYPFFLPVKVLSRVFRGKFLDLLQRVPRQCRPDFSSTLVHTLLQHDWVVYAKPAFGGPTHVLRYLGRYTHRVAISNQRLLSFDGHSVSFRWRDYARGNKQRIMALTATEFLRRFCQHVLPRGFVRIRHFGYLASAHRTILLALARLQLAGQPRADPRIAISQVATWRCPRCGANMSIGSNLTAQQLAFRSNCPTPHDSNPTQSLPNVCRHVFAHLRPDHRTTALSPVPACGQIAELPLPRIPTSHSSLFRLLLPDPSPRSLRPTLAPSSIAASTTASAPRQGGCRKAFEVFLSVTMPRKRHIAPHGRGYLRG
jgi:hypothetical protein